MLLPVVILSMIPMSPKIRLASTRATFLLVAILRATARLVATVVFPTPPFGLKTETTRLGKEG